MRASKHVWHLNSTPCVMYTKSLWNREQLKGLFKVVVKVGSLWVSRHDGLDKTVVWRVKRRRGCLGYCFVAPKPRDHMKSEQESKVGAFVHVRSWNNCLSLWFCTTG